MVTVDGGFDGSMGKVDCGISDCRVKVLNVFDGFSGGAVDDVDGGAVDCVDGCLITVFDVSDGWDAIVVFLTGIVNACCGSCSWYVLLLDMSLSAV